ncbi:DUF6934 family protein [Flavobacterium hauense]
MDTSKYDLSANIDFTVFEFTSTGKNGSIHKAVKYSKTLNENVYNLGFGDIIFSNEVTGEVEVDDTGQSNNDDFEMIINTVVYSAYIFSSFHPEVYMLFGSVNTTKMRLYRMFLSRNLSQIYKSFILFGAIHNKQGQLINIPFIASQDVEGYFVKRI